MFWPDFEKRKRRLKDDDPHSSSKGLCGEDLA